MSETIRKTVIIGRRIVVEHEASFPMCREEDPEYFVFIEILRPMVMFRLVKEDPRHPLIHLTTEWSKEEIIQLRDKLTETIEAMG